MKDTIQLSKLLRERRNNYQIKRGVEMSGLYMIIAVLALEFILLAFVKPPWLKGGILASILLGFLALFFIVKSMIKTGTENFVLESFGVLNMLLPVLFSIEIHLTNQEKPKKKDK